MAWRALVSFSTRITTIIRPDLLQEGHVVGNHFAGKYTAVHFVVSAELCIVAELGPAAVRMVVWAPHIAVGNSSKHTQERPEEEDGKCWGVWGSRGMALSTVLDVLDP